MTNLSRGAELLDALMEIGGPEAEAVKATIHRTQINAYRTGRKGPTVETAAKVEKASGGKVPAVTWGQPGKRKAKPAPSAADDAPELAPTPDVAGAT